MVILENIDRILYWLRVWHIEPSWISIVVFVSQVANVGKKVAQLVEGQQHLAGQVESLWFPPSLWIEERKKTSCHELLRGGIEFSNKQILTFSWVESLCPLLKWINQVRQLHLLLLLMLILLLATLLVLLYRLPSSDNLRFASCNSSTWKSPCSTAVCTVKSKLLSQPRQCQWEEMWQMWKRQSFNVFWASWSYSDHFYQSLILHRTFFTKESLGILWFLAIYVLK